MFNNSGSLSELNKQIIEKVIKININYNYEIIYINDGSKDNSLGMLIEIVKRFEFIRVINLSRNYGQQYAILAGWREAKGDAVIDMAADLQDMPEQCLKMINEWEKGNKIVVSYRKDVKVQFSRKFTSKLFYKIVLPNAPDGGFDFTLLDRQPLNELINFKDKNRFYQADILSLGFSFKAIPYIKEKRYEGKSGYSMFKRFNLFLSTYLNVSYTPIKIFSVLGISVTLLGFLYGITVLIGYFFGTSPFSGWTPIILLILIIGGLILTSLGITGQYIWRILDEVRGRPNYIIEKIIRNEQEKE